MVKVCRCLKIDPSLDIQLLVMLPKSEPIFIEERVDPGNIIR